MCCHDLVYWNKFCISDLAVMGVYFERIRQSVVIGQCYWGSACLQPIVARNDTLARDLVHALEDLRAGKRSSCKEGFSKSSLWVLHCDPQKEITLPETWDAFPIDCWPRSGQTETEWWEIPCVYLKGVFLVLLLFHRPLYKPKDHLYQLKTTMDINCSCFLSWIFKWNTTE